ncbi:gluconokinase [Mycobacterium parmense]|uniref:gluconokinase n=1 Tax=Mycobacterium parmense TaxID=185642 RepID=UPI000A161236|nr:gluconokinase [Mycobacterium parmense]MCV7349562.1 gluconokinase [Mycobacterium parmense]
MSRPSPVVVMGVSGSGKSTVGAALARRLHVPFADADAMHPPANIAKMTRGQPLTDDDRRPWLDTVGRWLSDHPGGVVSCSALKRSYRDRLRAHCPDVTFLHLAGPQDVIASRLAARRGHFMPATLLQSQFDALEPLGADERGTTVDVGRDVDAIVNAYLADAASRG